MTTALERRRDRKVHVPAHLRLKPADEPWTIQRLRALKPGEAFRYYRGHANDADIKETPAHSRLLQRVFAAAKEFEAQSAVRLTTREVVRTVPGITGTVTLTEIDFIAVGTRAPLTLVKNDQ
jgi:hypothetical protein